MFNEKSKKKKKNEKGIALLFSLIMLSLLLILALSFAMDSMYEQKAAYNSANASAAGSLAQVQLKQVLSLIENEATNFTTGNVYSIDSLIGWIDPTSIDDSNYPELIDMLQERFPVYGVLDENNDNSCLEPDVKVNWNYIRNNGPDGRIIGRAAFIIVPDEKIPLPSLVDERVGTTAYPKHSDELDSETRIGKYVSEINIRHAIPAVTTNRTTITKTLNWVPDSPESGAGFTDGEYTGSWTSFDDLFTTLENAIGSALTDPDKAEFQKNLTISRSDDAEAFWADKNKNKKVNTDELFRRFDLTRTDWDKTNWTDDLEFMREQILMLQDNDTSTVPIHLMQDWDEADDVSPTRGLPWLALFGYDKDGNIVSALKKPFDSVYDRRCQIAANLKDYCDRDKDSSDNYVDSDGDPIVRPTSNVDPSTWITASPAPAFTGNEQTPYINKIGVQIGITRLSIGSESSATAKALIVVKPWVELINIYQSTFPVGSLEIYISGSVDVEAFGDSGDDEANIPFEQVITLSGWTGSGYSDFIEASTSDSGETDEVFCATDSDLQVDVTKVTIERVVLYKNNGGSISGYDYVKQLENESHLTKVFNDLMGANKYCWYGLAVHDPRQNLNEEDWQSLPPAKDDDATAVLSLTGSTGGPYLSMPNASVSCPDPTDDPSNMSSTWYDKENSLDPVNLSTAYIRNAPMESPWELGFIQRGKKWQTINLKTYDPRKAISTFKLTSPDRHYIAGGGLYGDGDANILDQIKMVPDAKSPQKINLNCSITDGFDALFSKIRLGSDIEKDCSSPDYMSVDSIAGFPAAPTNQTEEIDLTVSNYTNVDSTIGMRKAIMNWFETSDTTNFTNLTRASIVGISTGLFEADADATTPSIGFSAATTDAAQEELIGKIVNLTKVGRQSGYFIAIVLAQTIKDVGGDGVDISMTKNSANGAALTKTDCRIGTFDANITLGSPDDSVYFDEITSEQKIMLKGRVLGDGQIKILSFQYID